MSKIDIKAPRLNSNDDELLILEIHVKKGDKVITSGGIHAKVAEVKETTVTVEIEGGVKLKLEKVSIDMSATSQLQNK